MNVKFEDKENAKLLWSANTSVKQAQKKFESRLFESCIEDAIGFWVMEVKNNRSYNFETIKNYLNYLLDLIERNILLLKDKYDQSYLIKQITELYPEFCKRLEACEGLSINEKKYRLNAFMAFTQFLENVTHKKIQKIIPPFTIELYSNREPAPLVLNSQQRKAILDEIKEISIRDYLVVKIVMTSGRNLNKILKLKLSDLDIPNNVILFREKEGDPTRFNPGSNVMKQLKDYIKTTEKERKDETLFITRTGNPVFRTHFQHILDQACENAGLGFKITLTTCQWSEVAESLIDHQCTEKVLNEFKLQSLPNFLETVAGRNRK